MAPAESEYKPPLDMFAGMTTNTSTEVKNTSIEQPKDNASVFAFLNATSDSSPNLDMSDEVVPQEPAKQAPVETSPEVIPSPPQAEEEYTPPPISPMNQEPPSGKVLEKNEVDFSCSSIHNLSKNSIEDVKDVSSKSSHNSSVVE